MLSYFLAIIIAIASLNLYLSAFVRPKIHRRDDFLWSALGLFYGLTLWICAGRVTGAILLSQLAIVTVAIAFMWENISLRKAWLSNENNTLEGFSVLSFVLSILSKFSKPSEKKETVSSKIKEEEKAKTSEDDNFPEITPEIKEALEKVEEEEIIPSSDVSLSEISESETSDNQANKVSDDLQEVEEDNLSPPLGQEEKDLSMVNQAENNSEESLVVNGQDESPQSQQKKGFFTKIFGGILGGKKKKVAPENKVNQENEEIGDNFIDNPDEDSNNGFFDEEESKSNPPQDIPTVIEEDSDLPIDEATLAESSPDEQNILDNDSPGGADDETILEKSSPDDETVLEEGGADDDETRFLEASSDDETLLEDDSFNDGQDIISSQEVEEEINPIMASEIEEKQEEEENIMTGEDVAMEIPSEDIVNSFDDVTDKLKVDNVNESDNWDFLDEEEEKDKQDDSEDETVDDILEELDKNDGIS
ncbi:hypothetical protein IQ215_09230 [Cyanobacterium stanieri LEGE 03274]|uniref:Ycf66 family protein n=1 Tax=Cyanobacterium stanieri LEGE 03274 TaxID=1828756 RepID=A0ABR9V4V2_9CHRO|nr:Ycf66 family protein [Cyanobacterium stanieri]MBE9222877.1 hypothetical protein [Cyanobacterium stanieri LEGE 03274]